MDNTCTAMFPGLWPPLEPRHQPPRSEAKVYAALKEGLPPGWYAWHALRLRTPEGEFGEADFVIADPARPGVLVLEVKGGALELISGQWRQNGRPLRQAPLAQALGFRKKLLECLKLATPQVPSVGAAICFPDTRFARQPEQSDLHGLVLGEQDLPNLAQVLPGLMERAVPRPYQAQGRWLNELHRLWGDCWLPETGLGRRAELDRRRLLRLDHTQASVLEMLRENPMVLITGGAGTGKTVLALEAARRHAAQGRRVLLLCFTEALAAEVAEETRDQGVEVAPVRGLAARLLAQAGLPTPQQGASWEDISLRAAADALPPVAERWDEVIVDEGQDFSEGDWLLTQECAAKGGRIWAFADQGQAFWPERNMPAELEARMFRLTLPKAYRCPQPIQHLADCYAGACRPDGGVLAQARAEEVIAVAASDAGQVARRVGKEVNRLVSAGIKPGDIAVLSLRGRGHPESITRLGRLGDHDTVEAGHPDHGGRVICDTFLRFKGLERPAVIVTDLRLTDGDYARRMHIAVTRALSVLRVVGQREAVERDEVLSGLL